MSKVGNEISEQDILKIKEYFYQNHGYMQLKDLRAKGLKLSEIRLFQDSGIIKRVEHSLYKWIGRNKHSFLCDVIKAVPDGVFCLESALYFHSLIEDMPTICSLFVPEDSAEYNLPIYPKIQLIRIKKKLYQTGVMFKKLDGNLFRVYDVEKTLCDCLKYRQRVGQYALDKAFHNYIKLGNVNEKMIREYGQLMRMKSVINRYVPSYLHKHNSKTT